MIRFIPCNKQKVQIMAEWKIGEIRQVNGEWYQCMKGNTCNDCAFYRSSCGSLNGKGSCSYNFRKDATNVIFKKLKKVGKPYEHYEKFYQCYKLPMETEIRLLPNNCYPIGKDNLVEIEIKQKEDMEENYKAEDTLLTRLVGRYVNNLIDYETFEKAVKELYSDKEESKPVLKEFDLEAAKAGKPVCTRDGRKARILCFDRLCCDEISTIIACVLSKDGKDENVIIYNSDGYMADKQHPYAEDLMMLPEKKVGWANIYRSQLYDTPEKAKEAYKRTCNDDNYLQTIKIEYEE